ncbi:MAG: hypothetical protein ACAI35_16100 [Candidatus Methylacidiphilales bacterium]|nr:hypothetical protein [Candidatus Methylacidiphilales bacterium]
MSKSSLFALLLAAVLLTLALPGTASACPVCYGAPGTQVTEAIDTAVLFMLGVVMVMLGSAGAFIWYLRGKAIEVAAAEQHAAQLKAATAQA